ncbi:hypothetical protein RND81_06G056900 [Saponaria officinalis]|uniref:Uncharacterized protein n=1 Tax=Saponaria officinalis TaxID=3572 RepID=A0AAW1K457_SAPOF
MNNNNNININGDFNKFPASNKRVDLSNCLWKEYFCEVIYEITTKPKVKAFVFHDTSDRHVAKERCCRAKRGNYLNGSVLTRSMQRRKNKEVNHQVKTRRMCMSKQENSQG